MATPEELAVWEESSAHMRAASDYFGPDLAYRRDAYIRAGLPTYLADKIIIDLNWLYTCKGLWPDAAPAHGTQTEAR